MRNAFFIAFNDTRFMLREKSTLLWLFIMPVVFSVIFRLLFAKQDINTDRLIDTQIDLLIRQLQGPTT